MRFWKKGVSKDAKKASLRGATACSFALVARGLAPPQNAKIEAELTLIKDLDRLDRLTDAILSVKSWSELLATT